MSVKHVWPYAGYVYLLRIPLIALLLLTALPFGLIRGNPGESILTGIFDVSQPEAGRVEAYGLTIFQFFFVSFACLMTGGAIGLTSRIILLQGHERFDAPLVNRWPAVELGVRLTALLPVVSVLIGAFCQSQASWYSKLVGIILGFLMFYGLTKLVQDWIWKQADFDGDRSDQSFGRIAQSWLAKKIPLDLAGYVDSDNRLLQRHVFALTQFWFSLGLYVAAGLLKWYLFAAGEPLIPTLCLVLILSMLFVWTFAAFTFFFDRYRVPVLLPFLAYVGFAGLFPQGDHFYSGVPYKEDATLNLSPAALLATDSPTDPTPVVLVATTGGGIQATAWTARVLTGLVDDTRQGATPFDRQVRLISAVSGGSVGAMYFAGAYSNTGEPRGRVMGRDRSRLDDIVRLAEESSLDQVTWGLTYPDLLWGLFPYLKGIGCDSSGCHLTNGPNLTSDRGQALEESWEHRLENLATCSPRLSAWRRDVVQKIRPAVIFNATVVETGARFLSSTTDFDDATNPQPREQNPSRIEFRTEYSDADPRVVTAARLSATFPWVTPAARMFRGKVYAPENHIVDGGYYDVYGMATLLEWLDQGLKTIELSKRPAHVLIVEIRSSPSEEQSAQHAERGYIFQTLHPLITLWNVRGTAQRSHNQVTFDLVRKYWQTQKVDIESVVFEFDFRDKHGYRRTEPLNWHLTPDDRAALQAAWGWNGKIGQSRKRVQALLSPPVAVAGGKAAGGRK
jgi:hypothetical protein